jgi:hypothetical protein
VKQQRPRQNREKERKSVGETKSLKNPGQKHKLGEGVWGGGQRRGRQAKTPAAGWDLEGTRPGPVEVNPASTVSRLTVHRTACE